MDNDAGKLLFGIETEFGFTARDPQGDLYDPQAALNKLLQVCRHKFVHLQGSDSPSRMYLANGALLYPDVGHPEFATAESGSPIALLQSLRACEKMLTEAAESLENRPGFGSVTLYRTNVDYADIGTTWGCHESYLSRRDPALYAARVVPHLVSRIVCTGAGGFNNRRRGANFVLSPRVFHLNRTIDYDSRGHRAVFSLRNEPLSGGGYHRVHLICGEANSSDLSNYLKVGTTALVLAMAEAGVDVGMNGRWVEMAVDAIRWFSNNPDCGMKASRSGMPAESAIELQYRYLEAAETRLHEPYMPTWAEDVCCTWRATLDSLASDPDSLVGKLDWPTKLSVFKQYVRSRSDLSWESLAVWSRVACSVSRALATPADPWPRVGNGSIRMLKRTKGNASRRIKSCGRLLDRHGLDWSQLDAFQDLRDELCELDIRFGQLYPRGIFFELAEAGGHGSRLLEPHQIDQAVERAPENGRARIRGDWIRRLAPRRSKYLCQWTGIRGNAEYLNLEDPFVAEGKWREIARKRTPRPEESPNFIFDFIDRSAESAESGEENTG